MSLPVATIYYNVNIVKLLFMSGVDVNTNNIIQTAKHYNMITNGKITLMFVCGRWYETYNVFNLDDIFDCAEILCSS